MSASDLDAFDSSRRLSRVLVASAMNAVSGFFDQLCITDSSKKVGPRGHIPQMAVVNASVQVLQVGEHVALTLSFGEHSDGSSGPLKPGDIGSVEELSGSRAKVQFNGRVWWYDLAALQVPAFCVYARSF